METKFQTSFIPKKTVTPTGMAGNIQVQHKNKGMGSLFMSIGVFIFLASLAAAAGSYAWEYYLTGAQVRLKQDLAKRREQFDTNLIEDLKQTNIKINMAKQLMTNHVAVSQVFDIVSRLTIQNVRFLSMEVTSATVGSGAAGGFKLSMSGFGNNFSTVAFQSDVLNDLEQYGLRKAIKNPVISDPSQDKDGSVSFNFGAAIDASSISYEKTITGSGAVEETGSPSSP